MRLIVLCFAFFFAAIYVFAAPLNLTGTAVRADGQPVENAVVLLKVNNGLVAYARTLSNASGNFELLPGKEAPAGEITFIAKPPASIPASFKSYQALDLKGRTHNSLGNLPQGVYVLLGKTEKEKTVNLGTFYHKGGKLPQLPASQKILAKSTTSTGDEVQLIVRKTGYLPREVSISSFNENVGTVILERDPLEDRIDDIMESMDLEDKYHQMNQALISYSPNFGVNWHLYGSLLHGGDGYSSTVLSSMRTALNSSSYKVKIPVTYGKDMMHGAAAIVGATVFPHNIGMGATRDSALVRRACEVTAKESWAGQVDLIFGPAISVPQNERWGRTYEGFGETAELAVMMGAACVRGYQGDKYDAPWRVIATAKHYLGDGGTDNGKDRGNVTVSEEVLRAVHLPGYEAVVEQGVLSVMASFNQINGTHQHVDQLRLTGWLKTELGFDGYIIADWAGISNSISPGATDACGYGCTSASSKDAVRKAINAGLDMAMNEGDFIMHLRTLVSEGSVSIERVNDAVKRILRAKFRAGRMGNIQGPSYSSSIIGSTEHREIAREAVRKSLVLLKNDNSALPISKTAKVYVAGTHANNHGYQCGGWTSVGDISTGWQGAGGTMGGATSIQEGINKVAPGSIVSTAAAADVIVYATGETPYAEWHGDRTLSQLNFTDAQLTTLRNQNLSKKIITVFISGRAMVVENLLSNSDAFVAAWLPGTEGAGIAEVLFNDNGHNFTGKLPSTWPRNTSVIPINSTEESPNWFPYGYGLSY